MLSTAALFFLFTPRVDPRRTGMTMLIRSSVGLVVLIFLDIFSRGGCDICVTNKTCILPCSFQAGQDVVIHWIYLGLPEGPPLEDIIHSYYHNTDQLEHQRQDFHGRTQLFRQQIAKGNASLLLSRVRVKDQGRYKCYTSTSTHNWELIINMQVEAPVGDIHIQQLGSQVSCRAEGIYPKPQLTWSTWPPSSLPPAQEPGVQESPEQLFTVSSSLTLDETSSTTQDVGYSCTVATTSSSRTATIFLIASLNSSSEATLHCRSSVPHLDLVWRFNHTEVILRRNSSSVEVSESWTQQVKQVSPSGNLDLGDLKQRHSGCYTCSLSFLNKTNVTQTHLMVSVSGDHSRSGVIIAASCIGVGVAAIAVVGGYVCWKKKTQCASDVI